ncbi:MAG: PilX N-terminal domain-containing pilus assembly protein, partial [Bacillota bacterium]
MMALSASTDEKGSSLVYTLVVVVVFTIAVVSLLQLAAMSFKTGKFEEERQQALAAAESGIAVASV